MAMTITFACQHEQAHAEPPTTAVCTVCGSRRVIRVMSPQPVIRAVGCKASGPLVRQETDR